jgi:RNA polymerase sigma factor (sigma-70 family)
VSIAITTLADTQSRFSKLLDEHRGIVLKVARSYCWHPDDRDELMQDIVMQLWRSYPKYSDTKSFSTWMYRIALNVSISWVRKHTLRQRHTVALGDEVERVVDTRTSPFDDDRVAFLQAFIEQLEPLDRALMLLYLDERSYADISDILGITQTNVATKVGRLKQRVRKASVDMNGTGASNGTR